MIFFIEFLVYHKDIIFKSKTFHFISFLVERLLLLVNVDSEAFVKKESLTRLHITSQIGAADPQISSFSKPDSFDIFLVTKSTRSFETFRFIGRFCIQLYQYILLVRERKEGKRLFRGRI